jgi:hypothetical protein
VYSEAAVDQSVYDEAIADDTVTEIADDGVVPADEVVSDDSELDFFLVDNGYFS